MEQRLIELETRLAFQEDEIEKLNAAILRQQQQIERLQALNEALEQRLQDLADSPNPEFKVEEEIPPHY